MNLSWNVSLVEKTLNIYKDVFYDHGSFIMGYMTGYNAYG